MKPATLAACLLLAGALLFGVVGRASIPDDIASLGRETLLHVCVDVEPGHPRYVVCQEQTGPNPGDPYTGSECAAVGLPPTCVVDLIPRVAVRGRMTLTMDERMISTLGNPDTRGTAILLEFKLGPVRNLLVDLFEGEKLGNWNEIPSESALFEPIPVERDGEPQFFDGSIAALGAELTARADAHFRQDLSQTIPVITEIEPDFQTESDHSLDDLASVTVRKFVVRFARARP